MALLTCSDISLELGGRGILESVSLDVDAAEVVGLAGPNGAGKTSLFEVLSGRQLRHGGDVLLDGTSIRTLDMRRRVERGLVRSYQRPIVPGSLTVGETLKAARKAYQPQPSRLKVEWAVEFVRLRAQMEQPTGSLETLERRKLMLACLLLRDPRIVLLDEPASGLTGSEIDEIDLVVRKLSQEYGVAVLLIEHRLELLAMVAKRVLVLDVGRIIASGPPETVFLDEKVRQAYFDVPLSSGALDDRLTVVGDS
ncbi:MAG: ATP-binding cassette domain-containing protein [Actinomycetales bacterium]|nr:ATP-binding cassette domain-containing protein [Actinomycetales bacterium]